jgi:tetratricopeptide (TPR) repeat protein
MRTQDGVALTLADLAKIARLRGDLKAALTSFKEARAIAQEIADKRAVAYALAGAGDVLEDQGDLQAACNSYQGSLALCDGISLSERKPLGHDCADRRSRLGVGSEFVGL